MLGRHFSITLHPDDIAICELAGGQCFSAPGQLFSATLRKHNGRGGFVTTQWEMQALFDGQGQPEGMFCVGYNITEFVDTQSRLASANSQFSDIRFMQSHLVRKPLANIIGLSQLISEELKSEKITQLCDMLIKSADELDQVVGDISDKTDE